jgi:hypothetical protein
MQNMATEDKMEKLLEEFKALDHESKKKQVIELLEQVKDQLEFAQWMLLFIANSPDISDEFLENNYMIIMNSALTAQDELSQKQSQERLSKINQIHAQHTLEENTSKDEAEDMLNNIV